MTVCDISMIFNYFQSIGHPLNVTIQVFILSLGPIDDRSNVSKICCKAVNFVVKLYFHVNYYNLSIFHIFY